MNDTDLSGKRVIVTGGASGMGEATVRGFVARGARVVSMDLSAEAGRGVALAAGAEFIACDVSGKESVDAAVAQAVALLGGLDVLVHAAGISPIGSAADVSLEVWSQALAVNATGTFLMNQAVFPHLKDNGGGRIINFASSAGVIGFPMKAAYAASKGAVIAWSRTAATDWAKHNITVNVILPTIWTPMYDRTRAAMTPEQLAEHDAFMRGSIPLKGKMGDPETDFLPIVVFVASDASQYMTGQMFAIDGGQLAVR